MSTHSFVVFIQMCLLLLSPTYAHTEVIRISNRFNASFTFTAEVCTNKTNQSIYISIQYDPIIL